MPEPEMTVTYTATAPARGRGERPDEAITDLLDELDQPQWGLWSIFGGIILRRDEDAYWIAEATVTRQVDAEI